MDAAAELGRNPVSKHQIQSEYGDEQADAGRYSILPNPSRETKFSGTNADRKIIIFPIQLTTRRTGNLTRLIHTIAICDDHTYIHTTGEEPTALLCCTLTLIAMQGHQAKTIPGTKYFEYIIK